MIAVFGVNAITPNPADYPGRSFPHWQASMATTYSGCLPHRSAALPSRAAPPTPRRLVCLPRRVPPPRGPA